MNGALLESLSYYTLFFLPPFLLVLAIPVRFSLPILLLLGVAGVGLLFFPSDDALAALNSLPFVLIGIPILCSPAVGARALIDWMHRRSQSLHAIALAGIAAFFLPFPALEGLAAGLVQPDAWRHIKPPDTACFDAKHAVQISETTYRIPSTLDFSVAVGKRDYFSGNNESLGQLYKLTQSDGVEATFLEIRPRKLAVNDFARYQSCERLSGELTRSMCGAAPAGGLARLRRITLESANGPADDQAASGERDPYSRYLSAHLGRPAVKSLKSDAFYRVELGGAERNWMLRNDNWINDAGDPFTVRCSSRRNESVATCRTTYTLPSGARLSYEFDAEARALELAVKSLDKAVHLLLSELSSN